MHIDSNIKLIKEELTKKEEHIQKESRHIK